MEQRAASALHVVFERLEIKLICSVGKRSERISFIMLHAGNSGLEKVRRRTRSEVFGAAASEDGDGLGHHLARRARGRRMRDRA